MNAPETSITTSIPTRPASQPMSAPVSAKAKTATLRTTRPTFRKEKSAETTWSRLPRGRTSTTSKVPSRIIRGKRSRWPITMSTSAKERHVVAYRNATSCTVQPSRLGTLWKTTRIATKSRSPKANDAKTSSAKERRYWSCDRICAPTSRT